MKKKMVTLCRGGLEEKTLSIEEIEIPDLWHIAMAMKKGKIWLGMERDAEWVLKTWHFAHDLKRHIQTK